MANTKNIPKTPLGRPSSYSQDIADEICTRLSEGESVRSIVQDAHMPVQSTVYYWLLRNKDFSEQYTRAREEQADTHADAIVDIADETPQTMPVYDKEGNLLEIKLDSAYIQWQKNRIEARKWTAMKLKPKKYSDRITHSGDDENPVVIENSVSIFGDLLKAIKQERQEDAYGKK